jgi:GH24 family phage-related lysozyme (muramidase)
MNASNVIKSFEGLQLTTYRDTEGFWTWGYACRIYDSYMLAALDNGSSFTLTLHQAEALHTAALYMATTTCKTLFSHFLTFSENQRAALTSLAYHRGLNGLLRFPLLIEAVNALDWSAAAAELLWVDGVQKAEPSHYAKSFPQRAALTAELLEDLANDGPSHRHANPA